jgi:hypothetical protein
MDDHERHDERSDDRKRDASTSAENDRTDVNRRRVEEDKPRVLTRRERQERWPIG